jgi:hypothetical protein
MRKTPEMSIISHWHKLFEPFNTSSQEFYVSLQKAIERREVPGLEVSRVEWEEGGLMSAKREYLRLTRERLVFDICAAPFGTGYFFSSRLGEIPRPISLLHILILLIALGITLKLCTSSFGFFWGLLIFGGSIFLVIQLLRNALNSGLATLDAILLKAPVIGPIYDRFFRPLTYYRIDLIHAYAAAVHSALLEIVDEITQARGLKPLSEDERKPIMKALYWK